MNIAQAKQKLISWAKAQVGTREGANNWNKYAQDQRLQQLYGWNAQNQPWCDLFTDAAFVECFGLEKGAAMTYQPIGGGSAACRYSAQFFKNAGAWYSTPEVGDVIFFYYDGEINHQGLVEAVLENGRVVQTIEGNSSDMVARRHYAVGEPNIAGFGRPKWSVAASDGESESAPADGGAGEASAQAEEDYRIPDAQYHSYVYKVDLNLLKIGDKGPQVQSLQLLLKGKGFPCSDDGSFGKETYDALTSFQTAAGILVDGECGGQSWAALANYRV